MSFKRRQVREKVLQALYAYELSHEPIDFIFENIVASLKKEEGAFELAKELILKVIETSNELDALINGRVANWEFNRLAILDKIILRICICELLYFDDIPPKVSINEAIEIARRYSTEKSDKFVNGVLDSVLDDLKKSGRMKKTGRGLVENSLQKKRSAPKPRKS
ncbi:MAG: transcription antitermination factor NusB [Ignavibacteriales bacterium]|nr:transcription antitermination factor NusB [Ignavibacteriales bacterium]MBI3787023.1 transcription antitermination factor NusB [Ignavibacteriales bacterium]